MDLDLRLVRSFVTVVEEGPHVGRAAQRLHLSQPALSKQLQRLEAYLGVQLFHRDDRNLRLTSVGTQFFGEARPLLAHSADVTDLARVAARRGAGRVIVAFVAGVTELASTLLQTNQRQRPDLDVQLLRVDWVDQIACLRENRADLSLVRLPINHDDMKYELLISEPRVAGFANHHPLSRRAALSIRELDAEPIIRTDNHQDYWTVNPRPTGAIPILGPLANTVEEMLAIVATGVAMCITADSLARTYPRPDITWIPIPDLSPSCIGIAWRNGNRQAAVRDVAQLAHESALTISSGTPAEPTTHADVPT